jgi:hypothetical protein
VDHVVVVSRFVGACMLGALRVSCTGGRYKRGGPASIALMNRGLELIDAAVCLCLCQGL